MEKSVETSGYQVQIALNNKFTKGRKTYTVSGTKKVFKGKKKKKYYIRVRAFAYGNQNNKVYGPYSSVKKKKTK